MVGLWVLCRIMDVVVDVLCLKRRRLTVLFESENDESPGRRNVPNNLGGW